MALFSHGCRYCPLQNPMESSGNLFGPVKKTRYCSKKKSKTRVSSVSLDRRHRVERRGRDCKQQTERLAVYECKKIEETMLERGCRRRRERERERDERGNSSADKLRRPSRWSALRLRFFGERGQIQDQHFADQTFARLHGQTKQFRMTWSITNPSLPKDGASKYNSVSGGGP